MSCRVLGRGVETAILAETVARARADRPVPVIAHYRPTDRNAMVASLLPDHGFVATPRHDDDASDEQTFLLPAEATIDVPAHITVVAP